MLLQITQTLQSPQTPQSFYQMHTIKKNVPFSLYTQISTQSSMQKLEFKKPLLHTLHFLANGHVKPFITQSPLEKASKLLQ